MSRVKLRYSDFWDRIDVDAFEDAIGWTPEYTDGDEDRGFCVFPENHTNGDTTGKFSINREKRVYNCWVCGGGSLLSLVVELKDLDIDSAIKFLYEFAEGDLRDDSEFVDDFLEAFSDVEHRVETIPYFNERVLDRFNDPMALSEVPVYYEGSLVTCIDYATSRWISDEVLERHNVRYNSKMFRPSPSKGKFAEDSDYEGPAIVFPHYWHGRLVGWQTRWLEDDEVRPEWVPKYTNTTDLPKESTIYGWDQLETDGRPTVVVESPPSKLFVESCGYPSVATFGSSVNEPQMRLLRRLTSGVILAPDNDSAGVKWRDSLTEYLKHYTRVWHLPVVSDEAGADIGDLASPWNDDPRASLEEYLGQKYEPGIDL